MHPTNTNVLLIIGQTAYACCQSRLRRQWCQQVQGRRCHLVEHKQAVSCCFDETWAQIGTSEGRVKIGNTMAKEWLMALSLLPLLQVDMRRKLCDLPFAVDASGSGFGGCIATGLAREGKVSGFKSLLPPSMGKPSGLILIELFGGLSGGALALELLGVTVVLHVVVECCQDSAAWVGAVCFFL